VALCPPQILQDVALTAAGEACDLPPDLYHGHDLIIGKENVYGEFISLFN
jgi:hypothetical protein